VRSGDVMKDPVMLNAPDQKRADPSEKESTPAPVFCIWMLCDRHLGVDYTNNTFQYDTKKMAMRSSELQKNDQRIT
jgi:hypothetical protein